MAGLAGTWSTSTRKSSLPSESNIFIGTFKVTECAFSAFSTKMLPKGRNTASPGKICPSWNVVTDPAGISLGDAPFSYPISFLSSLLSMKDATLSRGRWVWEIIIDSLLSQSHSHCLIFCWSTADPVTTINLSCNVAPFVAIAGVEPQMVWVRDSETVSHFSIQQTY